MIIQIYNEEQDGYNYRREVIPENVDSISLYISKTDNLIGCIDISWRNCGDKDKLFRYGNFTITCSMKTYIQIDKKHKFTIKDKNDLIKLYDFLSDDKVDKFIKDFRSIEKVNELNKDF